MTQSGLIHRLLHFDFCENEKATRKALISFKLFLIQNYVLALNLKQFISIKKIQIISIQ